MIFDIFTPEVVTEKAKTLFKNERAKMPQQVQMFIENNKQLMLGTNE